MAKPRAGRVVLTIDTFGGRVTDRAGRPVHVKRLRVGKAFGEWARRLSTFEGVLEQLHVEEEAKRVLAVQAPDERTPERSQPWYAADVLEGIAIVRAALARDDGQEAAATALHVGYMLARSVDDRQRDALPRKGGRARGAQLARQALEHDMVIHKYARQWAVSDELQDAHRSLVSYVHKRTGLSTRTIQRSLTRLNSPSVRARQ